MDAQLKESLRLDSLIRSFQRNGHRLANLDPLNLTPKPEVLELSYKFWGFTDADLDKEVFVHSLVNLNLFGSSHLSLIQSLCSIFCFG